MVVEGAQQPLAVEIPGGPSLNGHGAPYVDPAHESVDSKSDVDREATRYLSAATQLDLKYARFVVRNIVDESLRGVGAAAGADVVIVARWALEALRRRALRDAVLTCVLVVGVSLAVLAGLWIPLVAMLVLAMPVTAYERWIRFHHVIAGQMLRDRFDVSGGPPPRSPDSERRLAEVERRQGGNLFVFRGRSAFVGCGRRVQYRRMIVDVHLGKKGKDGKRKTPVPFTTQELHDRLASSLGSMGLADQHVEERLFVNGNHIAGNPEILPDELMPPEAFVSRDLLNEGARHPTAYARTYVCAQMRGWQGQLVVSLFARAIQANGTLHVEWSFNVLPPLRDDFLVIDKYYEQPRARQFLDCASAGIAFGIPALLAAPGQLARYLDRPVRVRALRQQQEYRIKHGQVFNYGSLQSIREYASGPSRRHYFLAKDQWTYVHLAEHTLLKSVKSFLEEHKVDLELFESQQDTIIKLISKTNIDQIKAQNVAVGEKAKINDEKK
jgi:hypothetical protein